MSCEKKKNEKTLIKNIQKVITNYSSSKRIILEYIKFQKTQEGI